VKQFYILEVYEDGTADYCKVKKGQGEFYVPQKMFGPWSPIKDSDEVLADIHLDILTNMGDE
jgi:hypothetical protein